VKFINFLTTSSWALADDRRKVKEKERQIIARDLIKQEKVRNLKNHLVGKSRFHLRKPGENRTISLFNIHGNRHKKLLLLPTLFLLITL
jgi:hypothetical protein